MLNQRFRTNEPDVIYQSFDQEVVAIYLPTGAYHSLVGVAGDIFLALSSGGAIASQVAYDLTTRYDAPLETISRDMSVFLEQMSQQSLIVPTDVAPAPAPETPAANRGSRKPYQAPSIQTYSDLQQLLLLDPVHDVSAAGWPNLPQGEAVATEAQAFQCRLSGPHVIFERFEDETVAMNVSSGAYFPLYGPAEDVFLLMPENPTLAEIQRALDAKYVLDAVDADRLLREYLRNLAAAGLVILDPLAPAAVSSGPRDLKLHRPGSGMPFSTLSFQILEDPHGVQAATPAGEGLPAGKRRYQARAGDLHFAAAGGEMIAVDLGAGVYYRLNEAAADVFELLAGRPCIEELAAALVRKYELPERDMIAAVMMFIWHMLRMGLVAAPSEEAPALQAPTLAVPARRLPFTGFDVTLHQDLKDLMRPLNVVTHSRPEPPPAERQKQLCAMVGRYFEETAARLGVTDRSFEIAGTRIRVRRAGCGDAEIERACAHLPSQRPDAAADLTIHVFDCTTAPSDYYLTLVLEKLHSNWPAACGARGEVLAYDSERFAVIYHPGPDVLSILDVERGQAYFLKRDASPLPYWEIGSPFRYILHHWFAERGMQFVHGGAVGTERGGVLLTGKGGSGKSTTSLLCAKAGLLYAGDDYCMADPETGFLFSLYNTGKLKGVEDLERIPEMAGRSRNPDGFERGGDGKGIFFLSEIWPERMTSGFPLRAILIPRVSGERDSRLEPCAAGEALLALVPSTIAQLPSSRPADCERLARIVRQLPTYVFHLGTDLEQIPQLVRGVLG